MNAHFFMFYALVIFTFLGVVAFIFGVVGFLSKHHEYSRLFQVLDEGAGIDKKEHQVLGHRWDAILESLSRLSLPKEGWQASSIHLKFLRAGIRDVDAPKAYYAVKSILMLGAPLFVALFTTSYAHAIGLSRFSLLMVLVAASGYYLPEIYLATRTNQRAKNVQEGVPDLIDLLVICTESGLGLDAALNRVSREIARTYPYLAEEIYLTNLEIRAGSGRNIALKNFAQRTNIDATHNLVSILTQADRFGTSVADSLRTEAALMRIRRMQAAEEMAAKIPVKMLVPMILCIFPSLFIVIIGPAIIQVRAVFQ